MVLRTLANRLAAKSLTPGATALRGANGGAVPGQRVTQEPHTQPAFSLSLGYRPIPSFPAPPMWASRQEAAVTRCNTTPLAGSARMTAGLAAQWRTDRLEAIREVGSGLIPPHVTRQGLPDGSKRDANGADPRSQTRMTQPCAAAG